MSDTQRTTIKYTNQEVFNLVAFHLFTQGERSFIEINDPITKDGCRYRGPRGLKCAIGALIPDSRYDGRMEGVRASKALNFNNIYDLFENVNADLLDELQCAHDFPVNWESTNAMKPVLTRIAEIFGLDYAILDILSFKDK